MSEPVSCNEQPVYQIDVAKTGVWFECTKEQFEEIKSSGAEFVDFRILYPSAAYEALKAENEKLRKKIEDVADVIGCQSALDKLEIVDRITSALVPPKNGDSK